MDTYNMIDFNEKKGFICDMDGVIYHGNRVLPGVAEFIQWLHDEDKEYLFLTNNSGYTPRELSQKLARMGLDVTEEHFYTSALATAAFLRDQAPGCSVFAIGEAGLLNALYDAGITMNDVNPDYVVVGEGRSYSLDTLTKATNLVWKGAKLIGANSDVSGPIENGIVPACRALVAPIEMATGTQAYFCGKPNPLMMRTGLKMLHCHSAEAVMVGDRMDTDVISGMESGMSTVLVLSGVSTRETMPLQSTSKTAIPLRSAASPPTASPMLRSPRSCARVRRTSSFTPAPAAAKSICSSARAVWRLTSTATPPTLATPMFPVVSARSSSRASSRMRTILRTF